MTTLGGSLAHAVNIEMKLGLLPAPLPASAVDEVKREMQWLARFAEDKPFAAITHCLCTIP